MHCDVMWCPLMWWAVICCEVMRCNGMRSSEFVIHCGWLRCHVVWFEMVVWGELEDDLVIRTTQIYSVLHSTTKYYSGTTLYYTVLLQYYSVLQRATPVIILYYKVLLQYYSVLESTSPVLLQYYSVLQSTTPVLLQSTTPKYYSSTTPYYKVLLQYYAVLQSTTPVLFCTTKYYSSTTLYYKVLLQYHSVLQRTTPVLVCTTKYYSSTTLYYKVLLQYYSVLQSTLVCTTKYYSSTTPVLHRTTPVLLCTIKYYSSTNSVLQSTTPVLVCTTHIYTSTTLYYKALLLVLQSTHLQGAKHQRHQMLCLPRKVTLMIDPRRIWNVIYNAQSNRTHPPTSPNIAPATQNDSHAKLNPSVRRAYFSPLGNSFCIENYSISRSGYLTRFRRILRLPQKVSLQDHHILRLPRKVALMIDVRRIWNVIYNARSNKSRPPTSPNAAPATKNDAHHWLSSHMKRHLQCAEQQASPRPPTSPNIAPATQNCTPKSKKYLPKTAEASIPMRGRFEHDPSMIRTWSDHELVISRPPVRRGYFSRFGDAFCIENYNISRAGYLLKFHRILRLPRKVTLQPHQMLRLPRKMMRIIDCRRIWNVIYNARSNRHHPPTSPNTAPAKQNCTPKSKKYLPKTAEASQFQCGDDSSMIRPWSEHDTNMIRPWTRHLAPARSPRLLFALRRRILYWKLQRFARRRSTQISPNTAPATKSDPPTSPNTAPATQNGSHDWSSSRMERHLQCAEQQASPSMPRKSALQNLSEILRERLHDPSMIRTWSEHDPTMNSSSRTRPFAEVTFRASETHFVLKIITFRAPAIYSKFHRILRLPQKVTLQDHQMLRLPRKVTLQDNQMLRLPRKVTLRHHQILRLPRKVRLSLNCYWSELLRSCYWAVTKLLLNCYWTELLLNCHWTVTELTCYWAVILNCYSTGLLLNWAVTQLLLVLNCYWTELLLNCYWYSTLTGLLLNCYWTDLLLN